METIKCVIVGDGTVGKKTENRNLVYYYIILRKNMYANNLCNQ